TGRAARRSGRTVGEAYAANTVGAIAGSFASGFILIPFLGLLGSLRLCAALNFVLAAALFFVLPKRDGDKATRRQGDKATRREKGPRPIAPSPSRPVAPLSSRLRVETWAGVAVSALA